ncbi:MAG: glycosyltransferase [Deltaproteobacteria bacterium]|nr:glycosyltransferase [Deltaproteobacteria bacterium]
MKVAVVIPAWNEAASIAAVIRAIPTELGAAVVVVDGGSQDDTVEIARAAGAEVVVERRPGYGRACLTGVDRADALGAEVVAFCDGSDAANPADLLPIVGPILAGAADFVLGSRTLGLAEPGALRPLQRAGNWAATRLIALRFGVQYTDLGSMRAMRLDELRRLGLSELAHGWPTEMQVLAAKHGLRIREVPMHYRRRRAGASKVSGHPLGAVRAGWAILRVASGLGRR